MVWIPMLPADDLDAAISLEDLFQEGRVFHYWDGEQVLGRQVSHTLMLTAPVAWDIYLLYSPGATWKDGRISAPKFWMHQLDERKDLLLDPVRLNVEVQKAIEANPKRRIFQ